MYGTELRSFSHFQILTKIALLGHDHWSVAVLTVTVHSSFFPTFDFFNICCFLHCIQSIEPHFYVTLYYNGSPYICDS